MMTPERQRRSLIAFFLGSTAAKLSLTDPQLVTIVSRRAYRDLSRTLHGMGTHPSSDHLLESTHQSTVGFMVEAESVKTQEDFDRLHDQWCTKTVQLFTDTPHPQRDFSFSYGQAQKWLNMALKYFAVLGHPALNDVYAFLHVPIDSIIYKQAASIEVAQPRSTAWSRLNREQYLEYQRKLREQIQLTYGESYAPLDWETDAWIQRDDDPRS